MHVPLILDIADGKAGVELKLANKLFKSAELDRLNGQIRQYKKSRYNNENLILVVLVSEDDEKNTILQDVRLMCRELRVEYIYIRI